MTDNWVHQYMAERGQRKNEEQIDLRKLELALAGAPRLFESIAKAVRNDVESYHAVGGRIGLHYERNSDVEFTVRQPTYRRLP